MAGDVWEYVYIEATADEIASVIHTSASAGSSWIEILHERTAEGSFWGARRYRATWSVRPAGDDGGSTRADVEIRPHSSRACELVVRLERPGLLWSSERTRRRARALAVALRDEIVQTLAARPKAQRRGASRPLSAQLG